MEGVDPGWKVPADLMGKTAYHEWHDRAKLASYLSKVGTIALGD
jgi:cytochrome c-type protein NapC